MPKTVGKGKTYSKVKIGNHQYYRARMAGADGKVIELYAKTEEKLKEKVEQAKKEAEDAAFRKAHPTVAEYSEKWLHMHSAHIQPSTLRGYTFAVREYIVKPLGDKYMSEVTADDIKMAMVPVSKRSSHTYSTVNMLVKSIFSSAEYSGIIKYNPAKKLNARGGVPSKEKEPLTDAQVEILLDTIQSLPPYLFVMLGLYAGLRREEILGLKWDCVFLDCKVPYIAVKRAWHSDDKKKAVVTEILKTPSARRNIPVPKCLADCLREERERSVFEYVIADSDGQPLSPSHFQKMWRHVTVRTTRERTVTSRVNGEIIRTKYKPEPGERCTDNPDIVCCLDFDVYPHLLRHTYITNLIAAGVDPKTVQYLAGHKNSKVTMDIYAKVKYNKPEELSAVVNRALG